MTASPSRPNSGSNTLLLFDIDGTLLRRAGPHHRNVLVDAVRLISGLSVSIDGIPVQGMFDPDIIRLMMRREGAKPGAIRSALPEIVAKAQNLYVRRCPDLSRKVCPGVRPLLRKLRAHRIPAGLVTGNLSRIGWRKMSSAGLRPYFRFGVFAERASTRTALARLAIREARRNGWIDSSATIVLIGDHPNDIKAARANGIRSVAVRTGLSPKEELAARRPDHLLEDLRAFRMEMLR